MHPRHVGRAVSCALSFLLILSCSTTVPPATYYVLGSPQISAKPTPVAKFNYTLAVVHFESAETLLRKSIIWQNDSQLGYYSYQRWAETPAEMFSYRLYQRALESGLFRHVIWGSGTGEVDLVLKGKITSFEEIDTPEGRCGKVQAEVALLKNDGTVLWSGLVGDTEPAAEENVKSVVSAITSATETAITSILSSVENTLGEEKPQ